VASGAEETPDGLRNEDALALRAAMGEGVTRPAAYEDINPYCFVPAIAPHLAAREAGVAIDPARLDAAHARLAERRDLVVVEGAGGWRVPLNDELELADWVVGRGWPVVLVVGLRLGCINHALLSAESISARGRLLGWIANRLPPAMEREEENMETLRARLPAPCLGVLDADAVDLRDCAVLDGWFWWKRPYQ